MYWCLVNFSNKMSSLSIALGWKKKRLCYDELCYYNSLLSCCFKTLQFIFTVLMFNRQNILKKKLPYFFLSSTFNICTCNLYCNRLLCLFYRYKSRNVPCYLLNKSMYVWMLKYMYENSRIISWNWQYW